MPSYLTPPRATHLLVAFYELSILSLDNCLKGKTKSCNKLIELWMVTRRATTGREFLYCVALPADWKHKHIVENKQYLKDTAGNFWIALPAGLIENTNLTDGTLGQA